MMDDAEINAERKEPSDTPITITNEKKKEKIIRFRKHKKAKHKSFISFQKTIKKTVITLTLKWKGKLGILLRRNSNFIPSVVYLPSLSKHLTL